MATNNYFNIYLRKTIQLAETIVIKSESSINGINRAVSEVFGTSAVGSDPRKWKYYMNISGEYHPQDDMMKVISLDTLEEIEFTKENLVINKATARAYQYGTRYYYELLSRYPKQEMLILGILYPADIEQAIKAKDGEILSYPKNLVEFNEYSFIRKLQDWIYIYLRQHRNPQYSVSDELVETATLGQMYLHMVPAIMNIRLRACKTNEAHSYHVGRYLASHGFLDEYIIHMTTKQALWFYRNINYIERYSGHKDIFEWLIEHVLTERDVPISEYDMYHDTTQQPNNIIPFELENIQNKTAFYPRNTFRKKDLNQGVASIQKSVYQLDDIFTREDPLTTDNARFHNTDMEKAKELMENSLSSKLKTKVLESSTYDYTDSDEYTLSDILVNHWIWRAFNGTYKAIITATSPLTGERYPLTSKEAIYLLYYAYRKSAGQEAKYIPDFIANRVPRFPTPSIADLRKHVPHCNISEKATQLAIDLMPNTANVYSIEDFYNESVAYWKAANLQGNLVSTYEHLADRAYAENMVSRLYAVIRYPMADEIHYEDWLKSKNIATGGMTEEHWETLYKTLLREGTGVSLTTTLSTRNLQKAMIGLFTKLSSYSIQLITDTNKSNIRQLSSARVRVGDRLGSSHSEVYLTEMEVGVEDYEATIVQGVDFDSNKIDYDDTVDASVHMTVDYYLSKVFDYRSYLAYKVDYHYPIPKICPNYEYGRYPNKWNIPPYWRSEDMLNLLPEETLDIVDVYQRDYGCSGRNSKVIDIDELMVNKSHPGVNIAQGTGNLIYRDGQGFELVIATGKALDNGKYINDNGDIITDWDMFRKQTRVLLKEDRSVVWDGGISTSDIHVVNKETGLDVALSNYTHRVNLSDLKNNIVDGFHEKKENE